jgi:hypothetical protein
MEYKIKNIFEDFYNKKKTHLSTKLTTRKHI